MALKTLFLGLVVGARASARPTAHPLLDDVATTGRGVPHGSVQRPSRLAAGRHRDGATGRLECAWHGISPGEADATGPAAVGPWSGVVTSRLYRAGGLLRRAA